MTPISLSCLAEYMTSGYARQRTVLREFKYPDSDESQARIKYYQDARDTISGYHRGKRAPVWLVNNANSIDSLALLETGNRQLRLKHNARAIRAYEAFFAAKKYEILTLPKWILTYAGIRILVRPDLYVAEKTVPKAIKLEFGVKEPKPEYIKIVSQCMLEGAHESGVPLPSSSVLFLDIPRGKIHKGARVGSAMRRNIEAACMAIEAIWPSI